MKKNESYTVIVFIKGETSNTFGFSKNNLKNNDQVNVFLDNTKKRIENLKIVDNEKNEISSCSQL